MILGLLGLSKEADPEKSAKLLSDYSLRISPKAKEAIEAMPRALKQKMNEDIREVISFYAHMAAYRPEGDE